MRIRQLNPPPPKNANFCQECESRIFAYGEPAFLLLKEICDLDASILPFDLIPEYSRHDARAIPILEFLEHKRFIVSLETDSLTISAKPRGKKIPFQDSFLYCWCKE